ncbi:MAG: hypothetical protein AMS18_11375 [Gemmatimonas sp. SG8_17]|nr:MAG: hypothetical protein AMS18_11375 [Gemmatimonas sp. SG8_17]
MQVDPIRFDSCGFCSQLVASFQRRPVQAPQLFNIVNNVRQQESAAPAWLVGDTSPTIFDSLLMISQSLYEQGHAKEEKVLAPWYNRIYVQHPNDRLQALADDITLGLGSNDDKATAAIRWVLHNFPYVEDQENYGYYEFWAPPTFALRKGSGDCEDGAFLVHSLLLHAGIPYQRIRTYGGIVRVGEGAATGGHAWTAYRRESDDEWVILDTSYRPTLQHVTDRPLMKSASLYIDNFFYFNAFYWVNLEDVDRIHDPGAIYAYKLQGIASNTQYETTGFLIDALA